LKCEKCGSEMIIKNLESNIAELDDDVIDGQIADFNDEEENGDFEELWATEVIYECEKCGNIVVAVQG
jgi:DNA-directed RNA polymerase subunit RPC12/RpoP